MKKLFDIQKSQNDRWYDPDKVKHDSEYRLSAFKDYALGIIEQTTKLMNMFSWKKHKLFRSENIPNAKEQIVDIIKYAIGWFLFLGGDEKELIDLFETKSFTLEHRWDQMELELSELNKVIIIDIDGCIADYSWGYETFLKSKELKMIDIERKSYSFHKVFGISKQKEEEYQEEFINAGGFKNLFVFKNVIPIMQDWKCKGYTIVLLTARPFWIYKRIYNDTIGWLKSYEVPYDMILWDKDKADAIVDNIFPAQVVCMIEDRDKHAIEVSHLNILVYLLDKSYNREIQDTEFIKRVESWDDIERLIK